jgi:hypothetical protein
MASIHKEIQIERSPEHVWAAIRDVGAVHERFARGFVVDTSLEPGARVVTFANGAKARELIVDVDEGRRRLAYSVADSPLGSTHHNASFEVTPGADGTSRLVWITDVLPDDVAPMILGMVEQGSAAIARTLME